MKTITQLLERAWAECQTRHVDQGHAAAYRMPLDKCTFIACQTRVHLLKLIEKWSKE